MSRDSQTTMAKPTDREIGEKIIDALSEAYPDADLQAGIGTLFGLNTEAEQDRVCRAVAVAAREALNHV